MRLPDVGDRHRGLEHPCELGTDGPVAPVVGDLPQVDDLQPVLGARQHVLAVRGQVAEVEELARPQGQQIAQVERRCPVSGYATLKHGNCCEPGVECSAGAVSYKLELRVPSFRRRMAKMKLLKCLPDEVEPFKAEIAKGQTPTTQYTKLAALRFIAHLHGIKDYNRANADELTQKLKSFL